MGAQDGVQDAPFAYGKDICVVRGVESVLHTYVEGLEADRMHLRKCVQHKSQKLRHQLVFPS